MKNENREKLDNIDNEIVRLFEERLKVVESIAKFKKENSLQIFDSAREREIIDRLTKNKDERMTSYIKLFYATLFDISKSLQANTIKTESKFRTMIELVLQKTEKLFPKKSSVACQGTEGSNSVYACEKIFVHPSLTFFDSFEAVCSAVKNGMCDYGILPIENSINGTVRNIYKLLYNNDFYVIRSAKIKINHSLLANKGADIQNIKTIYSHEQAINQCKDYLNNLNADVVYCENTATAAKNVSLSNRYDVAAIASLDCAGLYNLDVLKSSIQDSENNYTKFICISKKLEIYAGANKMSLIIKIPNRAGALYNLIAKFTALNINMTKIESYPIPNSDFEFMFYFDFDLSVYDTSLPELFSLLEKSYDDFKFLGCYSEI